MTRFIETFKTNSAPGGMANVLSLTGAKAGTGESSAWCIPSTQPMSAHMPICTLTMTSDGPRYMPTGVMPPRELRPAMGKYREISWTPADRELADSVWNWEMSVAKACGKDTPERMMEAVMIATDIAAVARFVQGEEQKARTARRSIGEHLVLGRSVTARLPDAVSDLRGWIASDPYDDDTISVVARLKPGKYRHIIVPLSSLNDDGSPQHIAHILRG
jgi:hypothetical protein